MQFSFQAPINAISFSFCNSCPAPKGVCWRRVAPMNLIVINLNKHFELLCSFHCNYFNFPWKALRSASLSEDVKSKNEVEAFKAELACCFRFYAHFRLLSSLPPPSHSFNSAKLSWKQLVEVPPSSELCGAPAGLCFFVFCGWTILFLFA